MKLLITACLREYQSNVTRIFREADIAVFSTADLTGFKNSESPNVLEEWFAAGDEKFDSLLFFSFTSAAKAEHGLDLIKKYNKENETGFPIRAFIVPVERSSY